MCHQAQRWTPVGPVCARGSVTPRTPGAPWAKPEHLVSMVLCTGEGQRLRHRRRMRAAAVRAQLRGARGLRLSSSPRKTFGEDTSSSDLSCGAAWQVQPPWGPLQALTSGLNQPSRRSRCWDVDSSAERRQEEQKKCGLSL